ncbi:MAG: ATP-binding protein [Deltaproteobacteria bacterium]|nr:ATP-binding protein [Deltaproteobacteria bacterium]
MCRNVVLVLEEAQNYIGQPRQGEEDSLSRIVFETIAREGRKYGLGLVVASQRPGELSKTVLSQCSSFAVHRLQNPEDLRYLRRLRQESTACSLISSQLSRPRQHSCLVRLCVRQR